MAANFMYKAKPIKVDTSAIDIAAIRRAEQAALDKSAEQAERLLQSDVRQWRTPVTFYTATPNEHERVVGTNSDIYLFNDQPTKAHKIRPRRARRLVFFSRGRWHYLKEVNHPGTKGKYLTKKAAATLQTKMAQNFDQAFADAAPA